MPARGPGKRSQRTRVLSQFRGIDLEPLEKGRTLKATHPSQILPNLLGKLRIDKRQADVEVLKVWGHLLDPAIVKHARPVGLRKGTLFIAVDSSAWLSELVRYRRHEILERLQHSFGRDYITKLSFRVE